MANCYTFGHHKPGSGSGIRILHKARKRIRIPELTNLNLSHVLSVNFQLSLFQRYHLYNPSLLWRGCCDIWSVRNK
jgi:hypothetical protein